MWIQKTDKLRYIRGSGLLHIPDTVFITHYWGMEWKPIRLWFDSTCVLKLLKYILKFCLDSFKDCWNSPRFVHACRIFCVKKTFFTCVGRRIRTYPVVCNVKRPHGAQTINPILQWMDIWFRDSKTAHYQPIVSSQKYPFRGQLALVGISIF